MDTIDWQLIRSQPGIPCALWWQTREEYWLSIPSGSTTVNTHIIVFRPPAEGRPPAIWLFQGQSSSVSAGTLYVDNDGVLQFTEQSTRSRVRIINGVLELDDLTGSYVKVDDDGLLQIAITETGAAALFVADLDTKHQRPFMIGYDGIVRELEVGGKDDVAYDGTGGEEVRASVRSRPFIYGDPLRNKKPRSVRLSAIPEEPSAEITVRLYGDGAPGQERTITIIKGSATRPRPARARLGGKQASSIQVEVEFSEQITLQAIEATSKMLDEVP